MKKYANRYGYSDIYPCEVIRQVSDKCLEIRVMKYEKDPSVELKWDVGGFAGHCYNQNEQKWFIEPNPENPVIRIRLRKNGEWKDPHGNEYVLADSPRRFYDYNF